MTPRVVLQPRRARPFYGRHPWVFAGAVAAVERLKALQPETIVPGHGPVCGAEALDEQLAYFAFVQQVAADAHASGTRPLDAARQADLGRFGEWHDRERLVGNLHRAMAELDGLEPGGDLDILTALGEMVTYNGGQPLRCLA